MGWAAPRSRRDRKSHVKEVSSQELLEVCDIMRHVFAVIPLTGMDGKTEFGVETSAGSREAEKGGLARGMVVGKARPD